MVRNKPEEQTLIDEVKKSNNEAKSVSLEDMPLETLGDYVRYNAKCRELNKKLGVCRYKIQQCPLEKHPKQRVIFNRKDQPRNPLPVYLSNEMIEFKETLIPGKTYDLPLCVIDHLASKGTPIWEQKTNPDGSKDTYKTATDPRFALRTIYAG